jgi:hypothetical protein
MDPRPRDNWGPVYEDCTVAIRLKATKLDICLCKNACLVNTSIMREMPFPYHATLQLAWGVFACRRPGSACLRTTLCLEHL